MKDEKTNIEQMIEAYFDCTLSEEQEKELKKLLATTELESPAIDEAKAVMGIFAAERKAARARGKREKREYRQKRNSRNSRGRLLRYAAAASFALVIGSAALIYSSGRGNVCVMYANGERISDESTVMAQMSSELGTMGTIDEDIDQAILNELQGMGEALEKLEI